MLSLGNVLNINIATTSAGNAASSNYIASFTNYLTSSSNSVSSSIKKAYSQQKSSAKAAYNTNNTANSINADFASSATETWIRREIADRRQAATNADEAISMLRIFDQAASSIGAILTQMAELAYDGAGSKQTYTEQEKTARQAQFKTLAGKVNNIVNSTQSGGNKLLSADGRTALVSVGNGSVIRISHRDLSIDVNGKDLSIATGGPGLAVVENAIEQTSSYREYLDGRIGQLRRISTAVDFDIAGITGTQSNLEKITTMNKAADMVEQIRDRMTELLQAQANVTPKVALKLLTG